MNGKPENRKPLRMFVSSMLIFGTIGIFRRYLPFSSGFLAFSRGILGGLFLLCCILAGKKKAPRLPARTCLRFVLTGAMIGVNWMLLFEAYRYTTVAVATLCYYMQPTLVILLSPLVFSERMTARKLLCAAAAVLGMILLSGAAEARGQEQSLRGILAGLGAAVFYTGVVILNKKARDTDIYPKTMIQLLSAGAAMLPYLLLTGELAAGEVTPAAVVLLAVVGIVHTGIAYVLYFKGLDGLNVQTVSVLSYIDPVSALFFSAFFLREPLTPAGILGAVMILGAAFLSEYRPKAG